MKKFIEPNVEIVSFSNNDAIATSYCPGHCYDQCIIECSDHCQPVK